MADSDEEIFVPRPRSSNNFSKNSRILRMLDFHNANTNKRAQSAKSTERNLKALEKSVCKPVSVRLTKLSDLEINKLLKRKTRTRNNRRRWQRGIWEKRPAKVKKKADTTITLSPVTRNEEIGRLENENENESSPKQREEQINVEENGDDKDSSDVEIENFMFNFYANDWSFNRTSNIPYDQCSDETVIIERPSSATNRKVLRKHIIVSSDTDSDSLDFLIVPRKKRSRVSCRHPGRAPKIATSDSDSTHSVEELRDGRCSDVGWLPSTTCEPQIETEREPTQPLSEMMRKYKLLKEPQIYLIKLETVAPNFDNHYSASEIEHLTKKYIDFLMNSNFSCVPSQLSLYHAQLETPQVKDAEKEEKENGSSCEDVEPLSDVCNPEFSSSRPDTSNTCVPMRVGRSMINTYPTILTKSSLQVDKSSESAQKASVISQTSTKNLNGPVTVVANELLPKKSVITCRHTYSKSSRLPEAKNDGDRSTSPRQQSTPNNEIVAGSSEHEAYDDLFCNEDPPDLIIDESPPEEVSKVTETDGKFENRAAILKTVSDVGRSVEKPARPQLSRSNGFSSSKSLVSKLKTSSSPYKYSEKRDCKKQNESSTVYTCIVCDVCFDDYSTLQRHLCTHTQKSHPANSQDSRKPANCEPQESTATSVIRSTADGSGVQREITLPRQATFSPLQNKNKQKDEQKEKRSKFLKRAFNLSNDCNICSTVFKTKEDLADHIYTHTEAELKTAYEVRKHKVDWRGKTSRRKKQKKGKNEECWRRAMDEEVKILRKKVEETGKSTSAIDDPLKTNEANKSGSSKSPRREEGQKEKPAHSTTEILEIDELKMRTRDPATASIRVCECHMNSTIDRYCLHIEILLLCHVCQVLFRSMECFETHYRLPDYAACNNDRLNGRSPKLFCTTCGLMFSSVLDIRQHLEVHARLEEYCKLDFRCNICKIIFIGVGSLFYFHWSNHTRNPFYLASRHSFPKASVLDLNETSGPESSDVYFYVAEHVCLNCKNPFLSEKDLGEHGARCPAVQDEPVNEPLNQLANQPANQQPRNQPESQPENQPRDEPRANELVPTEIRPRIRLVCSLCDEVFFDNTLFRQHANSKHNQQTGPQYVRVAVTAVKQAFVCNVCSDMYNTMNELEEHWSKHYSMREYFICTSCEKQFGSVDSFLVHSKNHATGTIDDPPSCKVAYQEIEFACKICNLGFESETDLKVHVIVHEKPFLLPRNGNFESDSVQEVTDATRNGITSLSNSKGFDEGQQETKTSIETIETIVVISDSESITKGGEEEEEQPLKDSEKKVASSIASASTDVQEPVVPIKVVATTPIIFNNIPTTMESERKAPSKMHSSANEEKPTVEEEDPPVPKRGFLRVKTLAELTEKVVHKCGECELTFDSVEKLGKHTVVHRIADEMSISELQIEDASTASVAPTSNLNGDGFILAARRALDTLLKCNKPPAARSSIISTEEEHQQGSNPVVNYLAKTSTAAAQRPSVISTEGQPRPTVSVASKAAVESTGRLAALRAIRKTHPAPTQQAGPGVFQLTAASNQPGVSSKSEPTSKTPEKIVCTLKELKMFSLPNNRREYGCAVCPQYRAKRLSDYLVHQSSIEHIRRKTVAGPNCLSSSTKHLQTLNQTCSSTPSTAAGQGVQPVNICSVPKKPTIQQKPLVLKKIRMFTTPAAFNQRPTSNPIRTQANQPTASKPATSTQPTASKPATLTQPTASKPATSTQPTASKPATLTQPTASKPATLTQPTALKPATSTQPTALKPATSTQPMVFIPATSTQPTALIPATSTEPTALRPATSTQPTASKPATLTQPTALKPATSTQPMVFIPATSTQPTALIPATSTEPTALRPATSTQPTASKPATSTQPTALIPATLTQPTTSKPATLTQPTTSKPATSTQPTALRPATSTQPTASKPATSTQPTALIPATSTQPTASKPATSTQPTASKPTTSTQRTASRPATSTQPIAPKPATSTQPIAPKPATSTQPTASKPATSFRPMASKPVTSVRPTVSRPATRKPAPSRIYYHYPIYPAGGMMLVSEEPVRNMPNTPVACDVQQQLVQGQLYNVYMRPPYVQQQQVDQILQPTILKTNVSNAPTQNFVALPTPGTSYQPATMQYQVPLADGIPAYQVPGHCPSYVCLYCPKTTRFLTQDGLESHMNMEHNYLCDICGRRLFNSNELDLHRVKHHMICNPTIFQYNPNN